MRLINVKTVKHESFLDHEAPPYAIVSHTWGDPDEELTVRDLDGAVDKPGIGSTKLRGCCRQAEKDGLGYVWMDTCCIDKRDLVELNEAITSMFRWYRKASVCYAYLSDVPADDNPKALDSKFRASRWFRRGWTLQELLAPENVSFYSSDWEPLGTKINLCTVIESITGIPRLVLKGVVRLQNTSVAQRMSWAAKRETNRKEDMAYSLQGIFGIAMSTIYGEGEQKAFFRLQEEIIKSTPDHSILAWGLGEGVGPLSSNRLPAAAGRVLAATPADFVNSGHIVSRARSRTSSNFVNISRGGVQIHLPLVDASNDDGNVKMGLLNCGPENGPDTVVAIPLMEAGSGSPDEYVRPMELRSVLRPSSENTAKLIHIKNDSHLESPPDWGFQYDDDELAALGLRVLEVEPKSSWDEERNVILAGTEPHPSGFAIGIRFRHFAEASKDFFTVIVLKSQGPKVAATLSMAVCQRETSTVVIREQARRWNREAAGKTSASNGLLNLEITLEPIPARPSMLNIRPREKNESTEDSVDITQRLGLIAVAADMTKAVSNLVDLSKMLAQVKQQVDENASYSEKLGREMAELASQIRRLQNEHETLAAKKASATEHRKKLERMTAEITEEESDALKKRTVARQRWDELSRIEYDEGRWAESTKNGWAPLLWACEHDDPETVQLLLQSGANPSLENAVGPTPLTTAIQRGHIDVVRVLLAAGADVNARGGNSGRFPLHSAASSVDAADMVGLLLAHGAEVNAVTGAGSTALHLAVRRGTNLSVVQQLLEKGADVMIKNNKGLLAFEESQSAIPAILDLVRPKGAIRIQPRRRERSPSLGNEARVATDSGWPGGHGRRAPRLPPSLARHDQVSPRPTLVAPRRGAVEPIVPPRDPVQNNQISPHDPGVAPRPRLERATISPLEPRNGTETSPSTPRSRISNAGTTDSSSSVQKQDGSEIWIETEKPSKSRLSFFRRK
ncbi:hypothetical protein B0T16DRAFT_409853 [Cercophora newfieldiana]|uniref:Heterokaryon incompatibility domain-containing protein n=1 Tax=Cercophora newfieldiana TaxID=92897 RepID=A0AA39YB26_9PEZI|nr:hypothetical protein B0T16DRAFT_409853 [Cercophora newfieldiana]